MGDKAKIESGLVGEITHLKGRVAELSALELELREKIERLRRSEELYKALVRTSPVAVTVVDLDGKITYVSDMTLKIHGYDSADDMLGVNAFDLIAAEDRDRAVANAKRTFEAGFVGDVVYKMLRKDGSPFTAELNASVVRDADGTPYAFIGSTHDITRRRQIESALRASEEKYRDLVENINDAIYNIDADGVLKYVSPAIEAMIGYKPSELIGGRALLDLVEPEDRSRALDGLQSVMSGRLRPNYVRVRTRSGGIRWLRASSRPIYAEGKATGIQGVLTDVTDRKRAEERVAFLGSITQRLRDAVIVTDDSFSITYANKAAEDLFGYTEEELTGKSPDLLLAEPKPPELLDQIVRTVKSGRAWEGNVVNAWKDGGTFVSELRVSPLLDERGRVTHFVGVQRDVTDKKRLEQQLLQAQKMEAVGTMAGGIAHDFNNVLTAIIGYSELLLAGCEPGSIMRKDVEEIGKTARRAAGLTRQLLSFSRRQPMQVAPLDLTALVSGLDRMLRRLLGDKIDFVSELSSDLERVSADAGRIEQVIVNLLLNSRDAMKAGGRLVVRTMNVVVDEASIRGKADARSGSWVLLQVEDSGSGMEPGVVDHIFEPFYTTKESGKGSGLGLSVVYGVVTQHGGWLDVSSSPGKGSTFSVYLPHAANRSEVETMEKVARLDLEGRGERVLLVEDRDDVRGIAERALVSKGYVVFTASNAAEAMDLYRAQDGRFDLVFSDLVLSEGGGFDLAERLRSLDPNLPILLTSGYAEKCPHWSTFEDRGYGFLEKPYELDDLVRTVYEALHGNRVREV